MPVYFSEPLRLVASNTRFTKEKDERHDAYVIGDFCHSSPWIFHGLTDLETTYGMRLCLGERDFQPGLSFFCNKSFFRYVGII